MVITNSLVGACFRLKRENCSHLTGKVRPGLPSGHSKKNAFAESRLLLSTFTLPASGSLILAAERPRV
jgi:hypothetical protein